VAKEWYFILLSKELKEKTMHIFEKFYFIFKDWTSGEISYCIIVYFIVNLFILHYLYILSFYICHFFNDHLKYIKQEKKSYLL